MDIDHTQYHGSALNIETGEVITCKCRPTLKGLVGQLDRLRKCFSDGEFKLCYEASYIGYTRQRDLVEKGYHCDLVAPTSIPSPEGNKLKQIVLMLFNWRNSMPMVYSLVSLPKLVQEEDRGLLRSRHKRAIHAVA